MKYRVVQKNDLFYPQVSKTYILIPWWREWGYIDEFLWTYFYVKTGEQTSLLKALKVIEDYKKKYNSKIIIHKVK